MAVFAANSQHLCMFVGAHTTQEITSLHGAQLSITWRDLVRPAVNCGISSGKNGLTLTHPLSLPHFHLEGRDGSRDIEGVVAGKILLCFGVKITVLS